MQRGWYETENEYYLLQFTLTVRCLYYTSFSLELCWQQLPAERAFYSFPWMVAYVFYYPVFHNGPILSFPEFLTQVEPLGGRMALSADKASVLVAGSSVSAHGCKAHVVVLVSDNQRKASRPACLLCIWTAGGPPQALRGRGPRVKGGAQPGAWG